MKRELNIQNAITIRELRGRKANIYCCIMYTTYIHKKKYILYFLYLRRCVITKGHSMEEGLHSSATKKGSY